MQMLEGVWVIFQERTLQNEKGWFGLGKDAEKLVKSILVVEESRRI